MQYCNKEVGNRAMDRCAIVQWLGVQSCSCEVCNFTVVCSRNRMMYYLNVVPLIWMVAQPDSKFQKSTPMAESGGLGAKDMDMDKDAAVEVTFHSYQTSWCKLPLKNFLVSSCDVLCHHELSCDTGIVLSCVVL